MLIIKGNLNKTLYKDISINETIKNKLSLEFLNLYRFHLSKRIKMNCKITFFNQSIL